MNYIEELNAGEVFVAKDNHIFLLTIDFKNNGQKLAYCLSDGNPRWFNANDIVQKTQLYQLDEQNNVIPIKTIYNSPTDISKIPSMAY